MSTHAEHLVVGPPGTGKTTYLARQTKLASQRYGKDGVMVASLTKTAAQEVGGRDTGLNPDRIGTLHAHAYRALDRPKIAEGKEGIAAWNEWVTTQPWYSGGAMKMNVGKAPGDVEWKPAENMMVGSGSTEALLQELGVWRARRTHRDFWPTSVQRFAQRWDAFKRETNMYDFTDLIELCLSSVRYPPGHPKVMMVDEAQDMSALEFALVRKWAEVCDQAVTVGDPDQCLYAWRGSAPEAMTDSEFKSENVLSRSYRVPALVHAYALNWIDRVEGRRQVEYNPRLNDPKDPDSGDARGEVCKSRHSWRSPEGVLSLVEQDLADDKTVMILASCSFMLEPMIELLRHEGVPFQNPYRPQHGGWNPMRGARRLLAYLSPSEEVFAERASPWTWADVNVWLEAMQAKGLLTHGAKKRCETNAIKFPEVEPSLVDLEDLFKDGEGLWKAIALDVPWWHGHLLEQHRKVAAYPITVYEKRGGTELARPPKLCIGTIHSVKGGQADSVYVWPSLSRAGWTQGWERPETRAATYRLFYVAFTRAREKLTLCGYECDGAFDVMFPRVNDDGVLV